MTDKQNTWEILHFGRPDRITGGIAPVHMASYAGVDHTSADGGGHHLPVGARWRDLWGVEWHKEHDGVMGFPKGNPLADLPNALETYRWPDPDAPELVNAIYQTVAQADRQTVFIGGSHRDTLWERAYMLCGMEQLMCLIHEEPDAVRTLLHRIMDFQLGIAAHYLRAGVEVVFLTDDLGMQHGPLLSPAQVYSFLLPEYHRLTSLYRSHGVVMSFHSCGYIEHLIDMFMDLGVKVLNPVQASANDLAKVRQRTQGRMALQGALSSQIMMEGPVERIQAEVKRLIGLLGRHGGYFCCPDQGMPWPEAHWQAYMEALERYGRFMG